jgi:hypothetical protein
MRLCGPLPFFQVETCGGGRSGLHWFLPSPRAAQGSPVFFGIHRLGTGGAWEFSEAEAVRLLCHFLIERLDDQGLKEAVETLDGMVRFYETPVALPKPLPAPQPVKMQMGEARIRPVFPVTEEG